MTALSSGEQLDVERSPQNSVLERPDAAAGDERRAPRSLDEIFPLRGDVTRGRQMQETWRAFGAEMEDAVRTTGGAVVLCSATTIIGLTVQSKVWLSATAPLLAMTVTV